MENGRKLEERLKQDGEVILAKAEKIQELEGKVRDTQKEVDALREAAMAAIRAAGNDLPPRSIGEDRTELAVRLEEWKERLETETRIDARDIANGEKQLENLTAVFRDLTQVSVSLNLSSHRRTRSTHTRFSRARA